MLLRVVAIVQAICLLPILIRFVILPPDFGAVGLWFFAIAVAIVTVPLALWQFARHPERRMLSAIMVALALVTVGLPMLMARFELDPIPLSLSVPVAAVLSLMASLHLLTRPGLWSPGGWGQGRFNGVLLAVVLIWIALIAAPLLFGLLAGFAPPLGQARDGLSIDTLLMHGASLGALGVLLCVFTLLFGLVGLWRDRRRFRIHLLQLLSAIVLAALLAVEAALISISLVNPG